MKRQKDKTTFGTLAIAMFWLVVLSGVLIAIPFNVENPYLSISDIMVSNPWASLIRNSHYWSAQIFLVLSLVHLYDHFHYKEKIGLKKGMAFRLSAGMMIIFLAMITGFLLKGDSDAQQARQILHSLTGQIPLIGKSIAFSLLGDAESYQLIYVHHVATFTIFIAIIMIEHGRKVWPSMFDFIVSFFAVFTLSYIFSAPLHDNINPTVKGPWYFVGFQEILHWLKNPGWSLLLFVCLLVLIYLVNVQKDKIYFFSKRVLLIFTGIYFMLSIIGLFFRGESWQWINPWDKHYSYNVLHNFKTPRVDFTPEFDFSNIKGDYEIFERKESCLLCHYETHGFTASHSPEAVGCFSCHGGNPFATVKEQSHKNMILIPGNLSNAKQSCGTALCHPEIVERVPTGLMATISGMISVDRFVFNEQETPDVMTSVHELKNSPADEHLKNLCVRCHLGNPKTEYGPVKEWSRGGGCLACHLNYDEKALSALRFTKNAKVKAHPSISLNVTNKHCFGCHNRSGRIATNYEGWHETTLKREDMPDSSNYRLVEGRRVFIKKQEDVHHKIGLECIDCHHSYELMGDGNLYAHQEDQQDVQCQDCHFGEKAKTISADNLDNESAIIASLRFGNISNKQFLLTNKNNRALINTSLENDSAYFYTKNSNKRMLLTPPADVCSRTNAHSSLSCSSCHTSWAPTCIGCHNSYDENERGYNMLKNDEQKGTWVEFVGEYQAKLPSLGIRKTDDKEEIIPVIPGMILTIDKKSFTKNENDPDIFQRLYAPAAPHTTATKGRSCKSCHNNPVALGYGEGSLAFIVSDGKGKWTFESTYQNEPNDNLPMDAWIDFLETRKGKVSTRSNVFPLSIEKQQQILTVGACLTCHAEDSDIMLSGLNNFEALIQTKNIKCILPDWDL